MKFGYKTLGMMLQALADTCFKAAEQEDKGEKVTACGMSNEDIDTLCEDILPNMLNPMMSTEDVKRRLGVSEATLNRLVERGDLPKGSKDVGGHVRWWKKWDILEYIKRKRRK
jgi:predicted DNA-binding transcriptional regulator AlpA